MAFDTANYPNPLDNDSSKDSIAFGKKQMEAMYDRWKNGYGSESWVLKRKRFDYNRAYATGKQPMDEFKDIINVDGQLSVINLDYSPSPIAVSILNKVKDKYMQRTEKVSCNAIDPFSQSKKEKAKSDALFKLNEKDFIQGVQQEAGIELEEFKESDPTDERELDIDFGFNYKQREEVVMENLIKIVLNDNSWDDVLKERILDDLINCGYAITKNYMDGSGRIKIGFVPPENFITSYSEYNDMRDWEWNGEVTYMSIMEIRLKYPKQVEKMGGEEALFKLAKSSKNLYGNNDWSYQWDYGFSNAVSRPYDSFRIEVVIGCYKTLYNLTYEKNTDRYEKEILDKATKIKPGKEYVKSKPYYVTYTGCMVTSNKFVLEWNLSKNMIKPEENLLEVYSPYTVYMYSNNRMINTPLIETMIPSIKMMQLLQLQTQKLIATTAPDGFDVDVTGLSDIDMGEGIGVVSPMQLFGIYLQTGVKYYKGMEDDGDGRRIPPIQVSQAPFSNKIEQLDNQWQKEYQKLITIVGSNPLDQGNISNQAVGKGVFQDARKQGESSSNYLYNAFIKILKETARKVQLRGWDILVYGKGGYNGYARALGEDKIEYIKVEATDDFEKTNFDVIIDAVIDDIAEQQLENNIQQCLAQKEITLEDAIQVRNLAKTNIKYATYYLASRQRKRLKEQQEIAMQNSQANTEQAIAAAKAKSEGDIALEQEKSRLRSLERAEELEHLRSVELVKYTSILKSNVAKTLLAKEGATVEQLPEWVLSGIGLVDVSNEQLMAQTIQEQEMEEQQMMEEEAMMQEQQMMQQQGGTPMEEEFTEETIQQ